MFKKKKKEEIQISKKTDETLHISQTESMRFSNIFERTIQSVSTCSFSQILVGRWISV